MIAQIENLARNQHSLSTLLGAARLVLRFAADQLRWDYGLRR
jgi:hypothetical protein